MAPRRVCLCLAFAAFALAGWGVHGEARPRPAIETGLDSETTRPGLLARLPDGRVLNFRCSGSGKPVVLLEGGWAATSLAWNSVRRRIEDHLRVCAYDRAGSGFSDPGPEPRDGSAIARDLRNGLKAAHITGRFILVGHSAGALYIRIFADQDPSQVAGYVFVDPSIEFQDRRTAEAFGPGAGSLAVLRARTEKCLAAAESGSLPSPDPALSACVRSVPTDGPVAVQARRLAEARRPSTWKTQLSELDALWTLTSREVATGRTSYGATPVMVLTAIGSPGPAASEPSRLAFLRFWINLHRELAARSCRGADVLVKDSSHLMMVDRPDAIAAAIDSIAAQTQKHTADCQDPNISTPQDEMRK